MATQVDRLVKNLNPRAKMPRGFGLWSHTMQIMWLKANQKKEKKMSAVLKPTIVDAGDLFLLRISAKQWLLEHPENANADAVRQALKHTDEKEKKDVRS